jgi:UDP-2,3-diacylglucosamine hydrolase
MATLFASDLHLDSEAPWAIDAFLAFLAGPARQAEALYLLGDLFEVWVGDDDDHPDNTRACAGLQRLTAAGVAGF